MDGQTQRGSHLLPPSSSTSPVHIDAANEGYSDQGPDAYYWQGLREDRTDYEIYAPDTSPSSLASKQEEQCFGMVTFSDLPIAAGLLQPGTAGIVPVRVCGLDVILLDGTQHGQPLHLASIDHSRTARIIGRLQNSAAMTLQIYCQIQGSVREQGRKKTCKSNATLNLHLNVYGMAYMFESVGKFFDDAGLYLQDPWLCDRDVPYKNPHLLVNGDQVVMTSSFATNRETESFTAPDNVFDQLLLTEELPEAADPQALKTPLQSHQKQALWFMLRRELQREQEGPGQIWIVDSSNDEYIHSITGEHRRSQPPSFLGGIVADTMGLGKTLQMISLIACDFDRSLPLRTRELSQTTSLSHSWCETRMTLVVLPLSLLQTWQDQLERHIHQGSLLFRTYYGPKRRLDLSSARAAHIVLTTYDIVVADYRSMSRNPTGHCNLFSVDWKRVILDEAHCIRSSGALRTKAVCALRATSRWAVSGTPIQNRLTDLSSLLSFLRAHPFDDQTVFDTHILRPWKTASDRSAVRKLRSLLKCIAIRRTKGTLQLPSHDDRIRRLDFSLLERHQYEACRQQIRDDALPQTPSTQTRPALNILRWIGGLRTICSYGFQRGGLEANESSMVGIREPMTDNVSPFDTGAAEFGQELSPPTSDLIDGTTPHEMRPATSAGDGLEETGAPLVYLYPTPPNEVPTPEFAISSEQLASFTKTTAVVEDVLAAESDTKSVIFSFWRAGLDSVATSLQAAGVQYCRVDGKISHTDRNLAIERFRNQPAVKVLLATISAAGVGLDLTVANRVCLLEPQWNPAAEEQALSRVHRMGQTKPVTTVRYVMSNSIEENILELQRRKIRMASLALSEGSTDFGTADLEDLKFLLK